MLKETGLFCKVVIAIVIIGALNWGLVGFVNFNLVDYILGVGSIASRVVYAVVGLSGIAILINYFVGCSSCNKP